MREAINCLDRAKFRTKKYTFYTELIDFISH